MCTENAEKHWKIVKNGPKLGKQWKINSLNVQNRNWLLKFGPLCTFLRFSFLEEFCNCDCCHSVNICNTQKKNSWKHTNRNFDTYFWPVFWLVLSSPASVERYRDRWIVDQNNLFLKCPNGKKLVPIDGCPGLFSVKNK